MRVDRSYACEIRDSYLHGGFNHGSDHSYGVRLSDRNSDVLVENNIMWQMRHSVVLESAGSGNVIAFNAASHPFEDDSDALSQDLTGHCDPTGQQ